MHHTTVLTQCVKRQIITKSNDDRILVHIELNSSESEKPIVTISFICRIQLKSKLSFKFKLFESNHSGDIVITRNYFMTNERPID